MMVLWSHMEREVIRYRESWVYSVNEDLTAREDFLNKTLAGRWSMRIQGTSTEIAIEDADDVKTFLVLFKKSTLIRGTLGGKTGSSNIAVRL